MVLIRWLFSAYTVGWM